jgi:hypothetical protein
MPLAYRLDREFSMMRADSSVEAQRTTTLPKASRWLRVTRSTYCTPRHLPSPSTSMWLTTALGIRVSRPVFSAAGRVLAGLL